MADYRTPIPALLAATLQSGINAVLALDTETTPRLERLEGRVLKLVLDGTGIAFYFTAGRHGIQVGLDNPAVNPSGDGKEADTTVTGTPAALFFMAAPELGAGWSGPGSGVNIAGDAALARDFERLFSHLDPDIESALAGLFGDVFGHQLVVGLREGSRRARTAAGTAGEVLGEVLREGSRGRRSGPLVGTDEARRFADDVDALRDAIDRLEARMRAVADSGPDSGAESGSTNEGDAS